MAGINVPFSSNSGDEFQYSDSSLNSGVPTDASRWAELEGNSRQKSKRSSSPGTPARRRPAAPRKTQAQIRKEMEYTPVFGLQFNANPGVLSAIANRIHQLGDELKSQEFEKMLMSLAAGALDVAAEDAMGQVAARQKRKGWAERARYPDRGGHHHLAQAIWDSREIVPMGDGLEFIGFNEETLNRETLADKGMGYWYEYEVGSRGTYQMPRGIWTASTGRFTSPNSSRSGLDRFIANGRGRRNNMVKGRAPGRAGGLFAHQAPQPILQEALEKMSSQIGLQIAHKSAEYFRNLAKGGDKNAPLSSDIYGGGSVGPNLQSIGDAQGYKTPGSA